MSIGERKQIQLERWTTAKDGNGNNVESVTIKVNTWAEVSRSGGDRSSVNGQEGLTNFFIFRIRFNQFDPTGNWRVIYDRRKFTPHSIEKEKQKRFYWIFKCEAIGER